MQRGRPDMRTLPQKSGGGAMISPGYRCDLRPIRPRRDGRRSMTGQKVPPSHSELKRKQRALRGSFPETLGLRVHRALSWLARAERETDDTDARFVFLWIGFNAAYAEERDFAEHTERDAFRRYFVTIVTLDEAGRVYDAVWGRFAQEIRVLLANRYVYQPFWNCRNGVPGHEDWEARFAASTRRAQRALVERDSATVLGVVFDRLYTLRNQILHGGATWNGSVNRDQLRDGAAILGSLLPVFLDMMMDHPTDDWGKPFYPVVTED